MKQVFFSGGRVLVCDVAEPNLSRRRLLVRTSYSVISAGTESSGLSRACAESPLQVAPKIAVGYSAAGTVIGVGEGVEGYSEGDRVACAGVGYASHAEVISVPMNLCVPVPATVSSRDAAFCTLGAVAMQGIRRADPRLGEIVVVVGLGLLGQLGAQMLSTAGCETIGVDLSAERIAVAESLGLDLGLLATDSNKAERILNVTDGYGADSTIIYAHSSSSDICNEAFKYTRRRGRIVVVGAVGMDLQRSDFFRREQEFLISCSYGPGRYDPTYEEEGQDYPYEFVRWTENRNMRSFLRLVEKGKVRLDPLVTSVFSVEDAPDAYEQVLSSNSRLAVVLRYGEEE